MNCAMLRIDGALLTSGNEGVGIFLGVAWRKTFHDEVNWEGYGSGHYPIKLVTTNWIKDFLLEGGVELGGYGVHGQIYARYSISPIMESARPDLSYCYNYWEFGLGLSVYFLSF